MDASKNERILKHLCVGRLGCFADDLHDEVPLGFLLEVGAGEFERVEEGVGGGEAHVLRRLLLLHAVDDRRQDLVRLRLKNFRILDEVN